MQARKESMAMKLAMTRIDVTNKLPKGHADRKYINKIVKLVNTLCHSNMSPNTVGNCAIQGKDQYFAHEKETGWCMCYMGTS